MEKLTIVAIVAAFFLVISVMAQPLPKPTIKEIGLLGKGLAISESDPKDVHEVKIGIATVTVTLAGQNSSLTAGIFYFDNTRYILKDINVSNKTASGDIFQNDTQVGTLQVSLTAKPNTELWSGTITLNSSTYNLYILEGKRAINALELGDKVSNYCTAHHEDQNCSDKINEFCQKNPQDARCIALFRNYCRKHLDEMPCRQTLSDYCTSKPNSDACKEFCQNYPQVCGIPVKKCENCPDGYRPTTDGFCAPNCGKGRKTCPRDVINCPSVTTTTTMITTTTVPSTTTTTTTTTAQTTTTTTTPTTTTTTTTAQTTTTATETTTTTTI